MIENTILPTMNEILIQNDLCLTRNLKGTDKGSYKSYINSYYSFQFASYRNKKIRLMEIGFRHGASLALWAKYFQEAEIIGLDNFSDLAVTAELPVVNEWISLPGISVRMGDAYNKEFSDDVPGPFDIIIDDGPHTIATQVQAIKLYLSKLDKDGVFVIEDILRGGLSIYPLTAPVPLDYDVHFYDYGTHTDNCLFVIKRNRSKASGVRTRLMIYIKWVGYVVKKIKQKLFYSIN